VLFENVPVYLCTSCQERYVAEGTIAQRHYEQAEANYALGAVYGSLAAALGGGSWAALAIFTQRIYALVSIGIAWFVAWTYYQGAKKIDRIGQLIGAVLTIAGVVFGEVLYYAYLVHRDNPDVPFRLDVGWAVFLQVLQDEPRQVVISLVFSLVGVWYVFRFLQQPRLKPKIDRPHSA
jgi:hypothetical protein